MIINEFALQVQRTVVSGALKTSTIEAFILCRDGETKMVLGLSVPAGQLHSVMDHGAARPYSHAHKSCLCASSA